MTIYCNSHFLEHCSLMIFIKISVNVHKCYGQLKQLKLRKNERYTADIIVVVSLGYSDVPELL